ncbi:hypothetical protein DRQ50_06455, partial [bacterium]
RDDGPGISKEISEDLFRPFKTTKEGGTGLGLSIVARIAAAHGGTARVEANPGGGAIFRVRWPQSDLNPFGADKRQVPAPETVYVP